MKWGGGQVLMKKNWDNMNYCFNYYRLLGGGGGGGRSTNVVYNENPQIVIKS